MRAKNEKKCKRQRNQWQVCGEPFKPEMFESGYCFCVGVCLSRRSCGGGERVTLKKNGISGSSAGEVSVAITRRLRGEDRQRRTTAANPIGPPAATNQNRGKGRGIPNRLGRGIMGGVSSQRTVGWGWGRRATGKNLSRRKKTNQQIPTRGEKKKSEDMGRPNLSKSVGETG